MGLKTIGTLVTLAVLVSGLLVAIIKAIWFRVEFGHESVTEQNGRVKLDKYGNPVVKTSGWRCQVPVRDRQRDVNCEQMTSYLTAQNIMAKDGSKYEVNLAIRSHVLNRRDGEEFKHHPARTLMVNDLNQYREEVCRDALRFVMSTSETLPSQWDSKDLFKAMNSRIKKKLGKVGLSFDEVMLPNVSKSEAQVHGDLVNMTGKLIKEGLLGVELPELEEPAKQFGTPALSSVPS